MKRQLLMIMLTATCASVASAQQPYYDDAQYTGGTQYPDGGQYIGAASVGSSEPMYYYDEQDRWKHGYIKVMPYYHGFHSFRPYNYHHVFGQSTTAQGFGMSPVMPYSQQFWHKYEHMADLSQGNHEPVYPGTPPTEENSHYPKPIKETEIPGSPSAYLMPPQQYAPQGYQMAPAQPQYSQPQQNYSQIFQEGQQIAPVQYQNTAPPQLRGPSLPAQRNPY